VKKTANTKPNRDFDRVLDLLWASAESGSVSAQKALFEHYRSDADDNAPSADWEAIYGDSNVTPLRRRAS
jgi:hypothetical protein